MSTEILKGGEAKAVNLVGSRVEGGAGGNGEHRGPPCRSTHFAVKVGIKSTTQPISATVVEPLGGLDQSVVQVDVPVGSQGGDLGHEAMVGQLKMTLFAVGKL